MMLMSLIRKHRAVELQFNMDHQRQRVQADSDALTVTELLMIIITAHSEHTTTALQYIVKLNLVLAPFGMNVLIVQEKSGHSYDNNILTLKGTLFPFCSEKKEPVT